MARRSSGGPSTPNALIRNWIGSREYRGLEGVARDEQVAEWIKITDRLALQVATPKEARGLRRWKQNRLHRPHLQSS